LRVSSNKLVILGVAADPEPEHAFFDVDAKNPMTEAYTCRPIAAHLLEVKRRMSRVGLEELK
jgi:hypothetical protein